MLCEIISECRSCNREATSTVTIENFFGTRIGPLLACQQHAEAWKHKYDAVVDPLEADVYPPGFPEVKT